MPLNPDDKNDEENARWTNNITQFREEHLGRQIEIECLPSFKFKLHSVGEYLGRPSQITRLITNRKANHGTFGRGRRTSTTSEMENGKCPINHSLDDDEKEQKKEEEKAITKKGKVNEKCLKF